ncbi:DUF4365 domain-containing protein [Hymenobacter terrenus]|uniref:DUF4365 domain-containing protein n=1 Tax=Hymenobacter terrenus TaxID=1629124 RepID=UPI000698C139|nr:DUF4365 domain-containing protein [Hymenobacter terrenus]
MTEEQIKEQLSRNYLDLLASRGGYKSLVASLDHGVDVTISKVKVHDRGGKRRLLDSGQFIDVQLKCTCEASIVAGPTNIKYDLEVKSYNDLIDRRGSSAPLILIVMVLPDNRDLWLSIREHEIALAKCAYWYVPEQTAEYTTNTESIRITIPKANSLSLQFLDTKFSEYYA